MAELPLPQEDIKLARLVFFILKRHCSQFDSSNANIGEDMAYIIIFSLRGHRLDALKLFETNKKIIKYFLMNR